MWRSGRVWEGRYEETSFPTKAVLGTTHEQITERMQEMGTYIDQDVRNKLNGMCEMPRVDVGGQLANFRERQQELEQCVRNVANAADDRLVENKNKTTKKTVERDNRCTQWVKGEMEENRNNTQQIQENKHKWKEK